MSAPSTITIRLSVRLWNGIDGGTDNAATNSMWEYWNDGGNIGDEANPNVGPTARYAAAIREEGRRQSPVAGKNPDQLVDRTFTTEQWEFILADATNSLPVYESPARTTEVPSRQEMLDSAGLCREAVPVITGALQIGRRMTPQQAARD